MAATRRVADKIARNIYDDIYRCSFKHQIGVNLKLMMDFGAFPTEKNLLIAAQFLRRELPVRLSHKVVELENLPFGLSSKAPVLKVRDWYVESFKEIHGFPEIVTPSDELEFTQLIHDVKERHNHVIPMLGLGIQELKAELGSTTQLPEIHQFLNRFFLSRIGIRMLIGQHVALHQKNPPGYIGLVSTQVSPVEVIHNAASDARAMCSRIYGRSPDVHVVGDSGLKFAYVPTHLHWMVFELLKNSLRSVQERFSTASKTPAVKVIVAGGTEDVTIKISDEGGGIPRSELPKVWSYFYSTGEIPLLDQNRFLEQPSDAMAGYGYGLPVTRLYARYFGGDLQLASMEGYGTQAYLHLSRLKNTKEPYDVLCI
ncbi:hypothetical protein SELMODRAFT_164498 [Selaginella moellendorffii]|uniref:Protein-serine/threonine kinase n=1 Tax=Selaginella moellendorffii TaxID=88036 RepID=D8QNZ5_SELML|nr:pyruvate dehydrogenase (acetyl-transferring) kinase, mitochondrial [Selaginella moellendorffii]EFJ38193.1 hypothetical protein SELMODRAFT_164498 [Selaginella moellendorffii]|eukprot:XP_002960654.1 pyruvate dehydrogenase (acetyl-transferring) kinase, mitochondrial [Selaginella moellendorffii]